jgi:hypothetical protein
MGHILSILWEILSILWEICYLIGIFCNHSSPPPPLSTTIWKVSSENFFWQREHNLKKSGKFLSAPLIFSFPYAHEQILWFKKIIIAAWTTFQFTGNCCYLAEVYTVTYLNASKSSSRWDQSENCQCCRNLSAEVSKKVLLKWGKMLRKQL